MNKRKCSMYYNIYIPWMYKKGLEYKLDKEDRDWYCNNFLLNKT